jgi:type I restriction enzyme, S subunit
MKMPEEWRKKTVGDLFVFTNGNGFKASDWSTKGLPIIRIQNLNGSNEYNFYNGEVNDKWLVNPGQLLFAWAGTKGVSFGPKIWNGPQGVLNQHIYKLDPKINSDSQWLYYAIMWVTGIIEKKAHGFKTTLLHVQKSDITNQTVKVPSLSEQKAIADLLSTWDEAIEKTERLIQAKEKQFMRLLNDLIYVPTIESKWKQVRAKLLFKERKESKRGDLPLLSITNGGGVIPREETNRKDTSNKDKSKYLRICTGDIGYNTMRMWQGVSALSSLEGIVSPAYTICIPSEKLHPQFVAYLFKMPFMIHRFYRYSQGLTSDTWNLKFRHFSEVKMPFPFIEEQKQIAETLSSAQQEIDLLKQLANKYKTQKRGLMQKVLTGEWRVKPEIVNQYMEA